MRVVISTDAGDILWSVKQDGEHVQLFIDRHATPAALSASVCLVSQALQLGESMIEQRPAVRFIQPYEFGDAA